MEKQEAHLVQKPQFKLPKTKFDGKYFRKRMREIRRSLPRKGVA